MFTKQFNDATNMFEYHQTDEIHGDFKTLEEVCADMLQETWNNPKPEMKPTCMCLLSSPSKLEILTATFDNGMVNLEYTDKKVILNHGMRTATESDY